MIIIKGKFQKIQPCDGGRLYPKECITELEPWFVYIVRCADGTFYTGISNDVESRVKTHNTSRYGAKYTRGRRPVELVYTEKCGSKGGAARREYVIKRLSRFEKMVLIHHEQYSLRKDFRRP